MTFLLQTFRIFGKLVRRVSLFPFDIESFVRRAHVYSLTCLNAYVAGISFSSTPVGDLIGGTQQYRFFFLAFVTMCLGVRCETCRRRPIGAYELTGTETAGFKSDLHPKATWVLKNLKLPTEKYFLLCFYLLCAIEPLVVFVVWLTGSIRPIWIDNAVINQLSVRWELRPIKLYVNIMTGAEIGCIRCVFVALMPHEFMGWQVLISCFDWC